MSIKLKKQDAASVTTPALGSIQLFADTDDKIKTKDNSGTVQELGTGSGGGAGGSSASYPNVFVSTPEVADAWDLDPAVMTDPDLANNGWRVHQHLSPYTTFTRAGEINPFSAVGGNSYRSSIRNGLFFMQVPQGVTLIISKQVDAFSVGFTLKVHAWTTRISNGSGINTAQAITAHGMADPTGPVTYNSVGTQVCAVGIQDNRWLQVTYITGNFPSNTQAVTIGPAENNVINYVHIAANGGGQQPLAVQAGTPIGFLSPGTPAGGSVTQGVQRAGLWVSCSDNDLIMIGSVRRLPYNTFP